MEDKGESESESAMIKKMLEKGREKKGKNGMQQKTTIDRERKVDEEQECVERRALALPIQLPTRIMKVVRARSIPRQRALPTLGDTVLGSIAGTLTPLMLLLLLLRRASLRIPIPIYHRRSQTRPATTTAESVSPPRISKQISFAHLSLPK